MQPCCELLTCIVSSSTIARQELTVHAITARLTALSHVLLSLKAEAAAAQAASLQDEHQDFERLHARLLPACVLVATLVDKYCELFIKVLRQQPQSEPAGAALNLLRLFVALFEYSHPTVP